ncbi:CG34005 [Drosophila busckii]|uniref:CG34005 n=1 Tax=Drosophila busckii TaxID=30019 RepID=A0A0M4EB25_DROBS|nr:uncharacterized protein LOC108595561 [Drosophila busckii]ALC42384.1 CG34005 [Drosophila busckii]
MKTVCKALPLLLLLQLLPQREATESTRCLLSLTAFLESHDVAGVGNTKHCFASYLPQLEQMGASWSKGYDNCLQQASSVRGKVVQSVAAVQQIMRQAALKISSYISQCVQLTDALDMFDCFGKLAKLQLASMYAISFNASEYALSLTQQLSHIEVERYLCTNATEQRYVMGTAGVFNSLDNCLQQANTLD